MLQLKFPPVLALLCLWPILPPTKIHVSAQSSGNTTAPPEDDLADFGQEVKVLGQVSN